MFALTQTVAGVSTKLFPIVDALGSIYAWVDRSGNVRDTYSFDVYGARTQLTGTDQIAWGFAGGEHDPGTGFDHFGHRYLNPSLGVWTQPDRAGFINGPNLYQYAMDNPVFRVDPLGLSTLAIVGSPNLPASEGGIGAFTLDGRSIAWQLTPDNEQSYLQAMEVLADAASGDTLSDTDAYPIFSGADVALVTADVTNFNNIVFIGHGAEDVAAVWGNTLVPNGYFYADQFAPIVLRSAAPPRNVNIIACGSDLSSGNAGSFVSGLAGALNAESLGIGVAGVGGGVGFYVVVQDNPPYQVVSVSLYQAD